MAAVSLALAPDAIATASADAFGELTGPYRHELLVHCYRMLGSIDDAEDAVQDALVRAWNGRATFQRAISFRAWLYRIATNAALDAIERRRRTGGDAQHATVEPVPDDLLEERSAGPEARYDAHESVSLAFLTALQLLSPRQRAVLILRDVLAWRAAEAAELLELSVPAANSALHRARGTIARRYAPVQLAMAADTEPRPERGARPGHGAGFGGGLATEPGRLRSLLDRYVRAWESADVAGLVALLREDAVVSMPPGVTVAGRDQIGAFVRDRVFAGRRIRLRAVQANGGPGYVIYSGAAAGGPLTPYAVVALEVDGDAISAMRVYAEPRVVARFGGPSQLPD